MTSATAAREAHGGVARLVEAERRWESALADARARAATIVSAAEAETADGRQRAQAALAAAVDARQRELTASLGGHVQAARDELSARTRQYTGASEETVARIAAAIVDRAPWFTQAKTQPPVDAPEVSR